MAKLTRTEKIWLIFFGIVLISLIGGCIFETVVYHKPIGARPALHE